MIGVIAKPPDMHAVQEFFELFKTPWDWYVAGRSYDLVLATNGVAPNLSDAKVLVIYDPRKALFDDQIETSARPARSGNWVVFGAAEFPLYGDVSSFDVGERAIPFLRTKGEHRVVGFEAAEATRKIFRLGYDLFHEVALLLSHGQPSANGHVPTLEFHISVLRELMVRAGVPFVEIPPAPAGYDFAATLTHDVDFTGIKEHKFDATVVGFLYRALVGSVINALKGRMSWSKCWTNWRAVLSLPLVYLGLQEDFWLEFDRYTEIEKELGSTFYFIPFKNRPGTNAPKRRAAKYDLSANRDRVCALARNGCEVGLHGIDAWQSTAQACIEGNRITEITGRSELGVRMHWLYFSAERSPQILEDAGFSYDSTFGYNDAIGFRAGTTQVFCFSSATSLLELPLNIQDTALFYPSRMNLSGRHAIERCKGLIASTARFAGVLTVNWHTRSLSPERLWGDFYQKLLAEMKKYRVWFGTAEQIVNWFRTRRSVHFEQVEFNEEGVNLRITGPWPVDQLPLVVRMHHPALRSLNESQPYFEIPWKGEAQLALEPELQS